ncbi:MAG: SBBP repeat-containing protein [Promethearchaeota archaeon]
MRSIKTILIFTIISLGLLQFSIIQAKIENKEMTSKQDPNTRTSLKPSSDSEFNSDFTDNWMKIWDNGSDDSGNSIISDDFGNVYVTGNSEYNGINNIILLKYDKNGNLLWNVSWGGSDDDYSEDIALDTAGNIYITGYTSSFGSGDYDIVLLKYNSSGNLKWSKLWGDSWDNRGFALDVHSSGNIYVTGYTYAVATGYDEVLLKYNSSGSLKWNRICTWGFPECYGRGLVIDRSENIYVSGNHRGEGDGHNILFLKYDQSGELLLNKSWGGSSDDLGRGIALDNDGNVYITGFTYSFGAGDYDILTLKYDSSGNLEWYKTWGSIINDRGSEIVIDHQNNILVVGSTEGYGSGKDDAIIIKYGSNGELKWYYTWGGSTFDYGYSIHINDSGNLLVTGSTESFASGSADIFILNYNPTGEVNNENSENNEDHERLEISFGFYFISIILVGIGLLLISQRKKY